MKTKLLLSSLFGVGALLASSSPLLARDGEGYVGIGVGESKYDHALLDKPSGYQIYFGNQYTKSWGIEIGYTDFGEAETADVSTKIDGKTASVSVKYYIPVVGKLDFYAQIGLHAWRFSLDDFNLMTFTDDKGTDTLYGGGLRYPITKKHRLSLSYTNFLTDIGDDSELDVSFASLNFEWKVD